MLALSFFCLSLHFSPSLYNAAVPPHLFWLSPPRSHATHVLTYTKHYIFTAQVTNPLKATVRASLFLLLCCCRRPTPPPPLLPPHCTSLRPFTPPLPSSYFASRLAVPIRTIAPRQKLQNLSHLYPSPSFVLRPFADKT